MRKCCLSMLATLVMFTSLAASQPKDIGTTPIAASPQDDRYHLICYSHLVGECYTYGTVGVCWSHIEGSDGYSILWSHSKTAEPDCIADLAANRICTDSYHWQDGDWYFSVRSVSTLGGCGSVSRIGPFSFGHPLPPPILTYPAWGDESVSPYDSLGWESVDSALAYCLYIDDDSAFGSPEFVDSQITDIACPLAALPLEANTTYYWSVKSLADCGWGTWANKRKFALTSTDIGPWRESNLPESFTLYQNYPNPFNPSTAITFLLPRPTHVTLSIYNVAGQRVTELADHNFVSGNHTVWWDGRDDRGRTISSGVYFYRLETPALCASRKMLLLK